MEREELRVRRGLTRAADAGTAVRDLAEQLGQDDSRLVLVFVSPDRDLDRLGPLLREAFPCPVVGCTTAGEVSAAGYTENSIVGVSFAGPALRAHVMALGPLAHFDARSVGRAADVVRSRLELAAEFDHTRLCGLLFVDGLSMREEQITALLHESFPGLCLAGGSAGDGGRYVRTHVLIDGCFRSDHAVAAIIESAVPFELFRIQHFRPTERKVVITACDPERRRVYEIDGGPAPEEYARAVGVAEPAHVERALATHPLMLRIGGEYFVRSIQRVHEDDSLSFFCAIDEGLVLTVAEGGDIVDALRAGFDDLRQRIPEPIVVLGFDCVLRRMEIERKGLRAEVERIFGTLPIAGFSTYGEQFNAVHINQTFVGLAFGSRS